MQGRCHVICKKSCPFFYDIDEITWDQAPMQSLALSDQDDDEENEDSDDTKDFCDAGCTSYQFYLKDSSEYETSMGDATMAMLLVLNQVIK